MDHEAGGYLTVALVVMESPAIIMAILLATWARSRVAAGHGSSSDDSSLRTLTAEGEATPNKALPIKPVLHEAFTDEAHL